jgi:hypothetical protein
MFCCDSPELGLGLATFLVPALVDNPESYFRVGIRFLSLRGIKVGARIHYIEVPFRCRKL